MYNETIEKLQKDYYNSINEIIKFFCIKQQIDFDGWVGDEIATVGYFADYFINFNEIVYDVLNDIESGKIFKYCDYCIEKADVRLNYKTYLKMNFGTEPKE